jgi:transposase
MTMTVIGIDIGKNVLHLVGLDRDGRVLLRRRITRPSLLKLLANASPCLIGMEASCGSHDLARALIALGHDARLMPAQYVKPFLKGQKNDYLDAEAIAEAVQRPTMRFVPVKTPEQLELQAAHRIRAGLVARRTGIINQIRGLLQEHGITIPKGVRYLRQRLPQLARDDLPSPRLARLIAILTREWTSLDQEIDALTQELLLLGRESAQCIRLASIPGIGAVTATAIVAAIGNGTQFARGRDFAAWLGLVPRQHSTGGRQRLLGITKRGNGYVRTLLVHGARAMLRVLRGRQTRLGLWLTELARRAPPNVATVALAAKHARIAWAVLTGASTFRDEPIHA